MKTFGKRLTAPAPRRLETLDLALIGLAMLTVGAAAGTALGLTFPAQSPAPLLANFDAMPDVSYGDDTFSFGSTNNGDTMTSSVCILGVCSETTMTVDEANAGMVTMCQNLRGGTSFGPMTEDSPCATILKKQGLW